MGTSRIRRGDDGATFLEYGLVASLVAAVVAIALGPFGIAVRDLIQLAVDAFP